MPTARQASVTHSDSASAAMMAWTLGRPAIMALAYRIGVGLEDRRGRL